MQKNLIRLMLKISSSEVRVNDLRALCIFIQKIKLEINIFSLHFIPPRKSDARERPRKIFMRRTARDRFILRLETGQWNVKKNECLQLYLCYIAVNNVRRRWASWDLILSLASPAVNRLLQHVADFLSFTCYIVFLTIAPRERNIKWVECRQHFHI